MHDDATSLGGCERCGAPLAAAATGQICPACEVAAASSAESQLTGEEPTVLSPLSGSGAAVHVSQRLAAGQVFGPYRIERLLGRGGMGEVYEAEHVEQGRRLALKVLNQQLAGPQDRARFLREGRLAASINHPNSVYIFGSEEILDTPVISMELLPGGTLKDQVKRCGPLAPTEAVDAVLQVIAGLETANAAGILHRDVKPANCFIDRDNVIKIGDFGLSISSLARDVSQVTERGTFQGTPQFASPEQMRGEPLDVRADIYSVGATLYYLLTGEPPFDGANLTVLLTRIATEPPRSPRAIQPKVPTRLAALVLHCLSKNRAARPATYAVLEDALRPFGSTAATVATLGHRFGAWLIDFLVVLVSTVPLSLYQQSQFVRYGTVPTWTNLIRLFVGCAYFGTFEGMWGASLGKRLLGLRVVGKDGHDPGLARGWLRALIFFKVPALCVGVPLIVIGQGRALLLSPMELQLLFSVQHPLIAFAVRWGSFLLTASLFITARRHNGFAGLHEVLSRTRVVQRSQRHGRMRLDVPPTDASLTRETCRIGPYDVVGSLGMAGDGELLLAIDPTLRRHVWIHRFPPGASAVPARVRDLSRPGRARWLGGRRTATEAWDAYEASDGVPLITLAAQPQPWARVKYWLLDLAHELDAGLQDGSLPLLGVNHVWVTAHGRAKLLDFPAPGTPPASRPPAPPTTASAQELLLSAAKNSPPLYRLPLSTESFINALARGEFTSVRGVVSAISSLVPRPDEITKWRRAIPILICALMSALGGASMVLGMRLQQQTPGFAELRSDLQQLTLLARKSDRESVRQQAALAVYVGSRFGATLADGKTWRDPIMAPVLGQFHSLVNRILVEHRRVSPEELTDATAILQPFLQKQRRDLDRDASVPKTVGFIVGAGATLVAIMLFGLVWSFALQGGLFIRQFGAAVVTSAGTQASRRRTLWRAVIAWAPLSVLAYEVYRVADLYIGDPPHVHQPSIALLLLSGLVVLAGLVWMIVRPSRGVQDYLARTWLVPR
jgi:uncharacterized RDD family membrane protein YckC